MSVDRRIVQMQFDNRQFEKGVSTTVKSLGNLKQGLNLDKSAKSLTNLNKVGRNFSLEGISAGVNTIASRFSMMGIVGVTALTNIANTAVNTAKRMINSLTMKPIMSGLQEYETKINAIQTILTNTATKGTSLLEVNKGLAELNEYADKTIYNFAQMTKNIGTFTAAGVDLDIAISSIKGIANLAAGSGSSALQASTAMYQLSQAIAAGSVKLQDWNSVVNAGMGGELFQNALKETAKEMGVYVDAAIPFRESLRKGWLSAEILTKTLTKFSEDQGLIDAATKVKTFTQLFSTMQETVQSGWAVSWEWIIGDFDTAKETLSAISDAFAELTAPATDARNAMLEFWNVNDGRTALLQALKETFEGLQSAIKPMKEAFRDIFPPMMGKRLVELTWGLRHLTMNFKIGEETADKIRRTFKGLFAILDIGKTILKEVVGGIFDLAGSLGQAAKPLLDTTASIGDFLVVLNETLKGSDVFGIVVDKIVDAVKGLGHIMSETVSKTKGAFGALLKIFGQFDDIDLGGLDNFSEKIKERFAPFAQIGGFLASGLDKMVDSLKVAAPLFYKLASIVGEGFGKLQSIIIEELEDMDFDRAVSMLNSGLLVGIGLGIKRFIDTLTTLTVDGTGMMANLTGILDGVRGSLESFQSNLKAKMLMKIATAIALLTVSVIALSMVDPAKLTVALTAMSVMFAELFGSMAIFETLMGGAGFIGMGKVTVAMIGLSVAILVLSIAMTRLAKLDWEGIAKGLGALAGMSAILIASAHLLSKSTGTMIKASLGLIVFAVALNILAKAVEKLGAMDPVEMANGLLAIGVLTTQLAIFMKLANFGGMGLKVGVGLIALSAALIILSIAVKKFGDMDSDRMIQGLTAVGIILLELALFTKLTGNAANVIATSAGLILLGAALLIFAVAVERMGDLSWEQIGKGLSTMAGILGILAAALLLMPPHTIAIGAGLVVIALALLKLTEALKSMSDMTWEEIGRGMTVLAGALGIIALAMLGMTTALPGAAALLVVAASLAVIAPILEQFASMSLSEIGRSLLMLAGALTVIGVAGLILAPVIPALIGLSVSIVMLGGGLLAAGAGLLLFSAGLAALAVSGVAGGAALITIITGLLSLFPFAFQKLGEGVVAFAVAIEAGLPALLSALEAMVLALIDTILVLVPDLVTAALVLLTELTDALMEYAPTLIKNAVHLIMMLLEAIEESIEEIVDIGISIALKLIDGLTSKLADLIQAGVELIIAFINGVADALDENTEPLVAAIEKLVHAMIKAFIFILTDSVPKILKGAGELIQAVVDGIQDGIDDTIDAWADVAEDGLEALKEYVGDFIDVGASVISGFIKGIGKRTGEVGTKIKEMALGALNSAKEALDIHSPSKDFYKIGIAVGDGMALGIEKSEKKVAKSAAKLSKTALDASLAWIADRKHYNELGLLEELDAWERIQARYKEGTEERKRADKEVYTLKKALATQMLSIDNDYYDKTKTINENLRSDIQDLTDAYAEAVKSRAESIYASYGLFEEVKPPEVIDGKELSDNLEEQLEAIGDWRMGMLDLLEKGVTEGLLKELQELGPKSLAQINALNTLTTPELNRYVEMWGLKHKAAKDQAITELTSLRLETNEKIAQMTADADVELEKLKGVWHTQLEALKGATDAQVTALKDSWDAKIAELRVGTENEFETLQTNVEDMGWEELGGDIVQGIAVGAKKEEGGLKTTIKSLAQGILTTVKEELGIKSPSKEFEKVGRFSLEGLAVGLSKYTSVVTRAASDVGDAAISSITNAVSKVTEVLNSDMDSAPTIRPVIDLTSVKVGVRNMNDLLATDANIDLTSANIRASKIESSRKASAVDPNLALDQLTDVVAKVVKAVSEATTAAPSFEFNVAGNLDTPAAKDIVTIVTKVIKNDLRLKGSW